MSGFKNYNEVVNLIKNIKNDENNEYNLFQLSGGYKKLQGFLYDIAR